MVVKAILLDERCCTVHFRMVVKGSIIYFLFFCKRQFKMSSVDFILNKSLWPIGNCCYQLAFSLIYYVVHFLQHPLNRGRRVYYLINIYAKYMQNLHMFFYEMKVISHKFLAFFDFQNGRI